MYFFGVFVRVSNFIYVPRTRAPQKWGHIVREGLKAQNEYAGFPQPASPTGPEIMTIKLTSVFVNDQNKALDFYTKTLCVVKRLWLTCMAGSSLYRFELVKIARLRFDGFESRIVVS